ncbi:DUF2306 domain-containing protein [Pseudoalteromonas phenolica]|uniref:DUF2306 domain-containing protein n=1 Tax=Pseudoalteromonas phenolica TaxID=161398 RepID=UPI00110B63F8|nr:DUF2306 domain-containing protein [Pseudoalteromonas phenolica]TMO54979.1 hypothetical protein CWC21_12470 [Pseudoalteromonas phenolica]
MNLITANKNQRDLQLATPNYQAASSSSNSSVIHGSQKKSNHKTSPSNWKAVSLLFFLIGLPAIPAVFIVALVLLGPDATAEASGLINARYFELPAAILVHGVSGIVFFFSLPTQFSTRLRVTRPKMHRVMGRLAVVSACLMAISGVWMHLVFSPTDLGARFISLVIVAIAICISFITAIVFAMKKNIVVHKIWMTRAVAITLAVVTPLFLEVILSLFINVASPMGELAISILHDYDRLIGLALNVLVVEVLLANKKCFHLSVENVKDVTQLK